ncbi:MAG: hypothetical protein D6731_11005, partial [Planctomycetota bacterium]
MQAMRWLLGILLVALATACASRTDLGDPEALEVVRLSSEPPPEPPAPPCYELELEVRPVGSPPPRGPVDLWLPLPASVPGQRVDTLVWEVVPPATAVGIECPPDSDRLLHVRSASGFPQVLVRARIARLPADAALPAAARKFPRSSCRAWLDAARSAGVEARAASAVRLGPGGVETLRVPELRADDRWLPVDLERGAAGLPSGALRLARSGPRAERAGRPLPLTTRYRLT